MPVRNTVEERHRLSIKCPKSRQRLNLLINDLLRIDAQRYSQAMANLLSNAAKHSPANRAVETHSRARGQQVHIEVRDYGSGIPDAFQPKIFRKLALADSSDRRQLGGGHQPRVAGAHAQPDRLQLRAGTKHMFLLRSALSQHSMNSSHCDTAKQCR